MSCFLEKHRNRVTVAKIAKTYKKSSLEISREIQLHFWFIVLEGSHPVSLCHGRRLDQWGPCASIPVTVLLIRTDYYYVYSRDVYATF